MSKLEEKKMTKYFLIFILLFTGSIMPQDFELARKLYQEYDNYKEPTIIHRRFKHADIVPLIEQLKNKNIFTVKKAGESAEGREIYLITAGTGEIKVFLWSQMHGDEPTATMALFDIFNFFNSDDFSALKEELFSNLTLYFMPMVNPDGAEVYKRRNIFDIDINRDAVRQSTPEGILLRKTFEDLNADFGFNLHDQSTRYTAGNSYKSATLSFLAPTFDYEKNINPVRENAIKLIAQLDRILAEFIPGHVAKYSDEFEPRAFGDNFQKWGTSTILVESGGWNDDPEKQYIRQLNFVSLLSAFKSIADKSYATEDPKGYEEIPFNENLLMDVLLKNLTVKNSGHEYVIDIGINKNEINTSDAKDYYIKSSINDLGDLSIYYGYEEYDLRGHEISNGKIYPEIFSSFSEIEKLDFKDLHKKGYTSVILNSTDFKDRFTNLPLNIYTGEKTKQDETVDLDGRPDFVISKNNIIKMVIINGFVFDIEEPHGSGFNGLVY
jgi:hypothetical protein